MTAGGVSELASEGFQLFPSVFSSEQVQRCVELLPAEPNVRHVVEKVPALGEMVAPLHKLAEQLCGERVHLCRSILFDKVPRANWKVAWHQDVTLAWPVRFDENGWGPWSVKDGVPHVQPPAAFLGGMVTLRLQLDDCGDENGPLRVLPGTHEKRWDAAELSAAVQRIAPVECLARRGDVLAMKPLLVHASSPSVEPRHRRVLHLEYAPLESLPRQL